MLQFLNGRTLKVRASEPEASKEAAIFETQDFRSDHMGEIEEFSEAVAVREVRHKKVPFREDRECGRGRPLTARILEKVCQIQTSVFFVLSVNMGRRDVSVLILDSPAENETKKRVILSEDGQNLNAHDEKDDAD